MVGTQAAPGGYVIQVESVPTDQLQLPLLAGTLTVETPRLSRIYTTIAGSVGGLCGEYLYR